MVTAGMWCMEDASANGVRKKIHGIQMSERARYSRSEKREADFYQKTLERRSEFQVLAFTFAQF